VRVDDSGHDDPSSPCQAMYGRGKKIADKKESWAKCIEEKAAAQAEADRPAEVSHARVTTLAMQRRILADSVQLALTRLANVSKPVPAPPSPSPVTTG